MYLYASQQTFDFTKALERSIVGISGVLLDLKLQ